MKTILTLIALMNLNTVDTHSIRYEPFVIETSTATYQIEEDYTVSEQFKTIDLTNEQNFNGLVESL